MSFRRDAMWMRGSGRCRWRWKERLGILWACLLWMAVGHRQESDEVESVCRFSVEEGECTFVNHDSAEGVAAKKTCWDCGALWDGWRDPTTGMERLPPRKLTSESPYWQYMGRVLSLNCKGAVHVRTVFSRTEGSGCFKLTGETLGELSSSSIVRCELDLPPRSNPTLQDVASAQELNCTECSSCNKESTSCPLETGRWYSDTLEVWIPPSCPPLGWPLVPAVIRDAAPLTVHVAHFDASHARTDP